jgi:hypothetical protein
LGEWFSSEKPINFMSESTTWEDIKRIYPEKDFSNIDLIQVEIKILKEQNLEKNKEEDY